MTTIVEHNETKTFCYYLPLDTSYWLFVRFHRPMDANEWPAHDNSRSSWCNLCRGIGLQSLHCVRKRQYIPLYEQRRQLVEDRNTLARSCVQFFRDRAISFVVTNASGIFISTDDGDHWAAGNAGLT